MTIYINYTIKLKHTFTFYIIIHIIRGTEVGHFRDMLHLRHAALRCTRLPGSGVASVARTFSNTGCFCAPDGKASTEVHESSGVDAGASEGADDSGDCGRAPRRMSMKEIQALHAQKASAALDPAKRAKISTGKVFRGSDGFLDFEEVPPPWKGREGPYKPIYLLYDANWILRKSKKADRILGGFSVAFVCGAWGVYTWAPHLLL